MTRVRVRILTRTRATPKRGLTRRSALEGSGDLRAAFLKNRGPDDHQQPQGGKEGEGTQSCNHRIDPS